jgi:hypothetical protein
MTRRLILSDLTLLARALLAVDPTRRMSLARHIIACADYADTYRRAMRRCHPRWGDGSIDAAARSHPLARPSDLCDPDFCDCLAIALDAWREMIFVSDDRQAAHIPGE